MIRSGDNQQKGAWIAALVKLRQRRVLGQIVLAFFQMSNGDRRPVRQWLARRRDHSRRRIIKLRLAHPPKYEQHLTNRLPPRRGIKRQTAEDEILQGGTN